MIHKRALLAAVVTAASMVTPAALAVPAAAAPGSAAGVGPTVTLLTGDKVTVGGMRGVIVHAAKGREHVSFYTREDEHGDTHVIPEDALALLSTGRLDPRLFDVTELVRDGYDDASRATLPLIVDYPGNRTPRAAGARVSRELPAVSAAAVSAERSASFWATARNADHVWLDGPVHATLDHSVPQIGAPEAWAAGHTGQGATVAVLDTGIDATHPDLSDAVVDAENFTDSDTTDDRVGHGTHVASIITGSGAASGGTYKGVAPDATLLNGKVLNDSGGGQESWIIAGMEWAAASGADVINMSLGNSEPSDGTDPMSQAVNRITAETGALFVIASGNSGYLVGSPGAADDALTVGAVDRDDQLAPFSSRGRTDGAIKPDVTAPGVDIVAAKAANGVLGDPAPVDGYVTMSGTSMATPHVAGAAAILAGEHPDWQAGQLKNTLMGTAKPTEGVGVLDQGAGRIDVAKATTATVFASPPSLGNGIARWPHDDDQPIAKTLTYTNTGAEPVTLDLSADVTGPNGSAAPQGMFTLMPSTVTVPAGGQASATLTTDTTVEAPDGDYGGAVTATGDGQSVRTPVAVTREVESYDVTVHFVDQNGAPTEQYFYRFVDVNNPKAYFPYDPSGTVVVRLPKGEFYFEAIVQTQKGEEFHFLNANFAEPSFTVTGDAELTVDAREAKPVSFTVDQPNAKGGAGLFEFMLETAWGETGTTAFIGSFDDFTIKPSTTKKKDRFTFTAESRMGEWNGTSFDRSPYMYNVRHTENGAVPETLAWTVHDRQLAKVKAEYAAATPGATGVRDQFITMPLPATITEFYTPDTPWDATFDETTDPNTYPPLTSQWQVDPKVYKRGRTTTERWNVGVFGPAFVSSPTAYFVARLGDDTRIDLPLTTDQGAGRVGFASGEGTTTLLRDGEVVAELPYPGGGAFTLDPERAEYTVRTTQTRADARLSTMVSGEWTFASQHVDGEEPAQLPVLAVKFAPKLDDHNTAPGGRRFSFPVTVVRNGGPLGQVNTPTVEVSYDDGVTWQPVRLKRDHGHWNATVEHPAGPGFVSLRTSVTDRDGNTHKATIIRAYELK